MPGRSPSARQWRYDCEDRQRSPPQALQGEVQLARNDPILAAETFQQAFARACQLGDPCWEGMAARGLALVAEATGESDRAFDNLRDARARCNRLADPYVWLDVHILDALCQLGRKHEHPETQSWVDTMRALASRTGMKELNARAMLHSVAQVTRRLPLLSRLKSRTANCTRCCEARQDTARHVRSCADETPRANAVRPSR